MESCNSCSCICLVVKDGISMKQKEKEVPIGFRFRPTDEELVIHYLRRKVLSLPLPASIVPDHMDVFRTHPSHLPGDWKEKRYFFSKRRNSIKSSVRDGYWKVIGKSKVIPISPGTVGLKTCLVFNQRKKTPSRWIMHEFRLMGTQECTSVVEMGDWVVCGIYQKKKKKKKKKYNVEKVGDIYMEPQPLATNVMMELEVEPARSSSASGITQVEVDVDDDEEACSASPFHLEI